MELKVTIDQVENFDACDYVVNFDQNILSFDGAGNGNIGGIEIPVVAINESYGPGQVKIVENVPQTPGVSGSGYLAVLEFTVLQDGNTDVYLSDGCISNNQAQEIIANWSGTTITVSKVIPVNVSIEE